MPEINRILDKKSTIEYLSEYVKKSNVAIDEFYKEKSYTKLDLRQLDKIFEKNVTQLFLKDKSFCTDDFFLEKIDNIHVGEVYFISQLRGDGQISILIRKVDTKYEISVWYIKSFEDMRGIYIPPSVELKKYYKKMAEHLKKIASC